MTRKIKIQLSTLNQNIKTQSYSEFYQFILNQIDNGKLLPIKNSGLNGKKPALYNSYWKIVDKKDNSNYVDELLYQLNNKINPDYYLKNPKKYLDDREKILKLSRYLNDRNELLNKQETTNERSFEIFGEEKYLDDGKGIGLLKKINVEPEALSFYETSVPMSYYTVHKETPQNFVIIENNDTFYSMRKHLLEMDNKIMNLEIGTLIYGAGKGIYRSFFDYENAIEKYFNNRNNSVIYFGDLDYEGIEIFEGFSIKNRDKNGIEIVPWVGAYEKMIEKSEKIGIDGLPKTKDGQKKINCEYFLSFFKEETKNKILNILNSRRYIPQEILNEHDY